MKKPIPEFYTERLILREVTNSHVPSYQKYFNDYEVISQLSAAVPWPFPENGVQVYLEKSIYPNMGVRLVRSLKELSFPILLRSSGPLASTLVEGCAGEASLSSIQSGSTQCKNGWFTIDFPKAFSSAPNFTATYRCNEWNYSSCPNVTVAIRGKTESSVTVGCFHSPNGRTSFDYGFLDWIATEP